MERCSNHDLFDLLARRHSARAYEATPVDRSTMEKLCVAARRAPSGANLQPGQFHVLTGDSLRGLTERLLAAHEQGEQISREYSYFPEKMTPELKDRQRRAGYALYQSLGIERRDIKRRREQFARNYEFFGAPVGVVVSIDRHMGKGCFMDLGMSMMSFLLAAEAEGLAATGIGAIANYGPLAHRFLNLSQNEMVVCGIAVGVADKADKVNQFRTERRPMSDFATFRGFV